MNADARARRVEGGCEIVTWGGIVELPPAPHPVDVVKDILSRQGEQLSARMEAEMRRICDERVQ